MRRIPVLKFIFIFIISLLGSSAQAQDIAAAFSPDKESQKLILNEVTSAKKTIEVAAYIFTSAPVSKALIAAKKRGVKVRIVADQKGNNNKLSRSALNALALGGVEVRLNSAYAIHHDKFMIIDSKTVQTGSLNYTSSAMSRNSENVLVIRNQPKLAQQYYQHWLSRFKEAEPYSVTFSKAE